MNDVPHILIVEDQLSDYELAQREIRKVAANSIFERVEKQTDFLKAIKDFQPDVILSDYRLPRFNAMKVLELSQQHASFIPVIIWTGAMSEDIAVDCMRRGAFNYIIKENLKRLGSAILQALKERETILQRKQAEEKYQAIFENSPIGIFQSTPQGRFINVNPALARIYGYSSPQEMMESITDIASQIYIESHDRNQFTQMLRTNSSVENFEMENIRKDGSVFWTSTSARTVCDESGNVLYYEGFLQDITERKEAEQQLRKQEQRFRALIENGMDNISLLAKDGTLLWENPAVNSTLGYEYNEFVNRNIFELMHPDDMAWTSELFAKVVREAGSQECRAFRLRHQDGTWRWVEATATNMLDEPSVNAVVINYRDITERKNAEEELRESQIKYRNLVETSHDLIWAVDAQGRLTFINRAAKDIYGYEPEELIGRSFFELLDPEVHRSDPEKFKEIAADTDVSHGVETYVRHKDGKQIVLSANSIVLRDENGQITGITGTSRDITRRKGMEEALRDERNLLRTLIDNLPDRIYAMDRQGRKTLSNSADWKASGKKAMEGVIGKTDFDIYPSELAELFWESDRAVLDSGKPLINFEEPGLDFEGNQVSILTTKIPLHDDEGNVIGLVGVGRDITERKQAEARINDLFSLNEKMLNHSPLGILTYKLSGECIFANENAASIIGANVESLRLQNFHSIEAWKKSGLYALVEKAIATKTVVSGDVHHVSTFGKNIWATVHCVTFTSNDEEHVLLSILDITDRKQTEQKLLQSQQELTEAQRVAKIGSWSFDPAKNEVHWSDELYRIFEIEQKDFAHTYDAFLELIHPEDRSNVKQRNDSTLENGTSFEIEYRIKPSGGDVRTISEIGYAVTASDGQIVSLFGTAQDITQRKRTEVERQALFEVMRGLGITNDLEEFLRLIHIAIAKVIDAENFFVVLHHPDTGLFEEIYTVDQYDPPVSPSRLEKSITSYVFRSGEPLLLKEDDFEILASRGEVELVGAPSASWLGAPLKTSNRTIGVIAVQDYQDPNRYSEHDKDFLASIAAQVALAVERKRTEAAEREQRLLAEALRDTSEILSSSLNYGEVLDHILTAVGQVVPHDAGTIMLIEDSFARVVRSQGYDKHVSNVEIMGIRLPLEDTTNLREMLETKQPVVVYDTYSYLGWKRMKTTDWLRSNVGAPISIGGEVIGFILLDSQTPGFFTPVHAERLEAFANQAAVAIHNAHLLQQAQNEIAERKRAEESLHAEQEKVQNYLNIAGVIMLALDQKGTVTLINQKGCEILGYSAEEIVGKNWMNTFLPEAIRDEMQDVFHQLMSGHAELVGYYEHTVLCRDGKERLIAWHNTLVHDAQGTIISSLSSGEDITERKRAEQELRASEERFRQLAENIEEVFWMTDAQTGREIYISPAGEKIWGRSLDYLFHEPDAFIKNVAADDRPRVQRALDRERSGERVDVEYRIPYPDGSIHWIWDRAFPIFDENGKVKMLAGIAADITERKQAEEALRESEARFGNAFEFAPIGIALAALDGKWMKVNQALCELLGYTEHELMSKTFQEITHPDDLHADLRFVDQILSGEIISYQMEKRYFHKTGNLVWALLSVSLVKDSDGKPQYYISQVQDISERKRAEEEIRRRAKETSALLETSLALTNLDLKAILQSIGSSAKALFAADGCRVFLMQPDGESLRCVLALQENAAAFSDLKIKLGEGVTGSVATSGKAEIVNEMQNDPRAVQVPGTENEEESIMFAPLKERERILGVLSIRRAGADRPFQSPDLELLEAFASMAASAVSNARLFEEAQQRLDELEALYENGLAVGQLLEPGEIGNRIIETFARYLSWHHVTIRLLRPETDELEVIAFNLPGLDEDHKPEMEHHFNQMVSKTEHGLSGWVVQTGTPLRTGNVHVHPRYVDTQIGIQSGLYMPLKVGDRIIGVISVESEAPDAFTEQDERLLATLGSQAAVAFENARLYQTAHKELLERTRAQAALWASETHYRELADSITDILFELDYNLTYTHWNKASEMFSGIPAEDAIGKTMQEVWGTSAEQLGREEIYKNVLKERQARTFETEVFPRGQKRVLEIHAYPSTRGASVVARDVTERKLDETLTQKRVELMEYSAHHSLEELMQRTVDEISELTGSHIGFLHFIEEDQRTVSLQIWSTETIRITGNVEHKDVHQPMESAGIWADALRQRRSIIHNDYESVSDRNGLPDDHPKVTRELIIPILRDERVAALLAIGNKSDAYTQRDVEITERFADYAWDIIERRQMEAALAEERNQLARRVEERTADLSRANSNLARALRVKDEFLANMSHELRTPLNAILGLSESLSEQVAGPLNEKQQKYLGTINESGHHLLSLINDILDLAKIEAGQITLDINKVDVSSVCQASLRMIKQLAQKKNQEVLFEIDSDLGLMWADERRLKQMIVNLLSNAVKFTPDSGKLGLEVHGDQAGNRVLITIWDHGIGISNQDMERLFKPFVQLDSGLAREATGTGLGLALVAQMARLHGGSVNVESQVGEGSRFTILLPWEPALAADASTRLRNTGKFRAIDPEATNKPTILLIEDTREVVMMLVDYLEMSGFNMVTAQDGTDGIQQAKLSHPDLILMDVMMPGMDGFETTHKLRMDAQFRDTPIIALTALAMPSDRQRCLDAGMDEYMSKPVNLKALVKLIRNILLAKEDTKPK